MNKNKIINKWQRGGMTTDKSIKTEIEQDVVIMASNNPSCGLFIVMPINARASLWLNDETQARKLAMDLANETQGRVICLLD